MSQSSELAGGTGFTFEDRVSARYLVALLQQGFAPGIADRTVFRVALQQRDFGEPLDDVIIDFQSDQKDCARLSIQVKQSLTISSAETNIDFQEIIRDCWKTLKKKNFRKGTDRYGSAVGNVAKNKARDLRKLCELARSSTTLSEFEERFSSDANTSQAVRKIKDDIAILIRKASGSTCGYQDLKDFLAHFVLIEFDFLHEGQADLPPTLNDIRACLLNGDAANSSALWDRLCTLVREGAGHSAVFDRPGLVRTLSSTFRLASAPSFRKDLENLKNLAQQWLADIENDVGGTRLKRSDLSNELESKLASNRWIQIRGLPGSGKSVLLRQRVEADLIHGPVLFLKSDRLEGNSWGSFATAIGISNANLQDLLIELAATGSNIIYIDGIDRIEKQHRTIILEVVRAVLENPQLDHWRIVVSLRDSGIEPLRNWLGNMLSNTRIATIEVEALNNIEAEILAKEKPHLGSLLFGPKEVQEVVRRPFFAKILNQNFGSSAGDDNFKPQSEIDLIDNWWSRGGYDSDGQKALERQRAIVEIGLMHAKHLDRDIAVRKISAHSFDVIDQLVGDGILQHVRVGHTIRFSHDIFFEWAFFHVLTDSDNWMHEIIACGEPPAIARVVELLSQWEFGRGQAWIETLKLIDNSTMRSQWTRAWLIAPLTAPNFLNSVALYDAAIAADDHHFLRKVLVWFQAERTTPNPMILQGDLPQEKRIRVADLLGWPSDFGTWTRFILFLLARISTIPITLYPSVICIFEVWQNAFTNMSNAISDAILNQSAAWLNELSQRSTTHRRPLEPSRWASLGSDIKGFEQSLIHLIFRSAEIRPDLTKDYLTHWIDSPELWREQFKEVVTFSQILARSHPSLLVELTFKYLRQELPEERIERKRRRSEQTAELRKQALAKPPEERTKVDRKILTVSFTPLESHSFDHYDWNKLSIKEDLSNYNPPSPLREPFRSLFESAPDQSLRLLAELSNHAITSWRQLQGLEQERHGTPVPLEIEFPWGKQQFWGGDRQYFWFRGIRGPHPIACGYLALEDWAFAELERGRSADEMIQQIVYGNHCIAVLGVAIAVVLQAELISETAFPIVTSQRLLSADHNRMLQDCYNSIESLVGFSGKDDLDHVEAVKKVNARLVRRRELSWLLAMYFFSNKFRERTREAVLGFVDKLPFQIEQHRNIKKARDYLRQQALQYAELVDFKNYMKVPPTKDEDQTTVVHVSPTANSPERVARAEQARMELREKGLWVWGSNYFETGHLGDDFTVQSAIEFAKSVESPTLFGDPGNDADAIDMSRSAISAAAAVALDYRDGLSLDNLEWARDVLKRIASAPKKRDVSWSPRSLIPWHHCIFVARGLAADIRRGTAAPKSAHGILNLVTHQLESVSLSALEAALSMWDQDARLGWSAMNLALSLCVSIPSKAPRIPNDGIHSSERIRSALEEAIQDYDEGEEWIDLFLPPPAWIKVERNDQPIETWEEFEDSVYSFDPEQSNQRWEPSREHWYSHYAAEVIKRVPFAAILRSTAALKLLDLLSGQLEWTISKLSPPWIRQGRGSQYKVQLYEWSHEFGGALGKVAGLCSLSEVKARFLKPIFSLEDDHCWELLAPFVDLYICMYVYDAEEMPANAPALLMQCLDRFLKAPAFAPETYHSGELYGFDQPRLAKSLMFVSIDELAPGAKRYANGNWSNIGLILPLVDRFVRSAGWTPIIMSHFLKLCERSKAFYPAEEFADQVLHVINGCRIPPTGWQGTLIPAKIAELIQYFADKETPMPQRLGQKLLRILDQLVDMGDRRSAALQLSESFREIKIRTEIA